MSLALHTLCDFVTAQQHYTNIDCYLAAVCIFLDISTIAQVLTDISVKI